MRLQRARQFGFPTARTALCAASEERERRKVLKHFMTRKRQRWPEAAGRRRREAAAAGRPQGAAAGRPQGGRRATAGRRRRAAAGRAWATGI